MEKAPEGARVDPGEPSPIGSGSNPAPARPAWFDEEVYLRLNPDIAAAVSQRKFASGFEHYALIGRNENRELFRPGAEPSDCLVDLNVGPATVFKAAAVQGCHIEAVLLSRNGALLVIGWVNDTHNAVVSVKVGTGQWQYKFSLAAISRVRRKDVEQALGIPRPALLGFFAFGFVNQRVHADQDIAVTLNFQQENVFTARAPVRHVDDVEMRNVVMTYIGQSEFLGNAQLSSIKLLDGALGQSVLKHNRFLTDEAKAQPYVARFGNPGKTLLGSIIVCLYGKAEFFVLQQALFFGLPGIDDYEFIYVSNSPELAEVLMNEAKAASLLYGLNVTLVLLPGNAGFGAANNVAAHYARTDRLVILNPDVFPKQADWAARHTRVLQQGSKASTTIFGVPLYYDDGSLMHAGMFFELDAMVSMNADGMHPELLIRVEHYGKGAPENTAKYLMARPVPAVTGAFISVDKPWFERIAGFTEDFVFGHYEDADLCLKSIEAGCTPWLQDIRLWHLEGKGSTRLPVHDGGSTVNRWLFTRRWSAMLTDTGLLGPAPALPTSATELS